MVIAFDFSIFIAVCTVRALWQFVPFMHYSSLLLLLLCVMRNSKSDKYALWQFAPSARYCSLYRPRIIAVCTVRVMAVCTVRALWQFAPFMHYCSLYRPRTIAVCTVRVMAVCTVRLSIHAPYIPFYKLVIVVF